MKRKVLKSILSKLAAVPAPQQEAPSFGSLMLLGSILYNSPDFQIFVFSKTHRDPSQLDPDTRTQLFREFAAGSNQIQQ